MANQHEAIVAAVIRLKKLQLHSCFDPNNPESLPTATQLSILTEFGTIPQQWIVSSNQAGKTATLLRNLSWFLKETHPYWKRRPEWKKEPLLALLCGRTGKQLEELALRLVAFFDAGEYKLVKTGNQIQRIELRNGNRLIFQSLENPHQARERVQSYVAHFAAIDEQPPTASLIGELLMRVQARNGYFMATFTPLEQDLEVKRMVEGAVMPLGKKYRLQMFDNPVYRDAARREAILTQYAHLSEGERNARLYGEWYMPSSRVYYYDRTKHSRSLPPDYSPNWRHVEAVDPATSSKLGYVLAAEDPATSFWYIVKAKYIEGMSRASSEILSDVLREGAGHNIVKRVYDPGAAWFFAEARKNGLTYIAPYDKTGRKLNLIKGVQSKLGATLFVPDWNIELIGEFTSAQWADTGENRIANSQKYHLTDALQYLCDLLPPYEGPKVVSSWAGDLRAQHKQYQTTQYQILRMRKGRSKWIGGTRRLG